jgi:hypothetical protein
MISGQTKTVTQLSGHLSPQKWIIEAIITMAAAILASLSPLITPIII